MQLTYTTFGEGQPVIILHGLFGSARNWQAIARNLSESFYVVSPDLRNHGNSPHAANMDYFQMADDVHALISELKLDAPVIIGHSMGGKVAMTLALSNPTLLKGLIVVDIAPVKYEHDYTQLISAMRSLSLSGISSRAEAETLLKQQLSSDRLAAFILQNLARTDTGLHWKINLEVIAQYLPDIGGFPFELDELACERSALFIGGSESSYIKDSHHEKICRYFPVAEIKMLTGAGHWTHVDKPEEFLFLIKNFIDSL